ncbi:MAG TPA: T9SS type A sorting domain-containing protein [Salinivirgaceae bacterium]|nr:T9SS type A sorting domain-containing protein [Salinivirgaceae bacterium]
MKKILLICSISLSFSSWAQFTTPGNGSKFSLSNLVAISQGTIIQAGNHYLLQNNLTIATTDTLSIETDDSVLVSSDVLITINGVMLCTPPNKVVFRANDTTTFFIGFRFENSNGSRLEKTHIEFAGGNKVIGSNVQFINCRFYKNNYNHASGALDIFQCNPIIYQCEFIENQRSAILSAANAYASPSIINSTFIRNSTLNTNRPQINLGAGNADMPLIIRGNRIEGGFSAVGGLSVLMLMPNSMTAIIDSNIIVNNRYGINIQGNGILYTITNNQIRNNNLETNPMNGGSGISFNGLNSGYITNNLITGNLWGVTILNGAMPNLGQPEATIPNPGLNKIFNNGNSGNVYNLYNNTSGEIYAQNCYWGTNDVAIAEDGIWHYPDNSLLGEVHYLPIYQLSSEKEILSFSLTDGENTFPGEIVDHNISVTVPENTNITSLAAWFTLSPRALAYVDTVLQIPGFTRNNFSEPVVYTIVAEDTSTAQYTVTVSIQTETSAAIAQKISYNPNPVKNILNISSADIIRYVEILDINGTTKYNNKPENNFIQLNLSNLTDGVFIVKLIFDDRMETIRIIKD